MSREKESFLQSVKITITLSAHMFYACFTWGVDALYIISMSLLEKITKHKEALKSVIPDKALNFLEKLQKEIETNKEAINTATEIVKETFESARTTTKFEETSVQDTVQENCEVNKSSEENPNMSKTQEEADIKIKVEHPHTEFEKGLDATVQSIVNITVGDIHIHNISKISSIVSTLKKLGDEVSHYDPKTTSVEDLQELGKIIAENLNKLDEDKKGD